jgi:glycerol-3-phosphate dehydrogenase (NAD(P)+)
MAHLLASNGHEVVSWARSQELVDLLNRGEEHPNLAGFSKHEGQRFTTELVAEGFDMLCEGVTSAGIRPVFGELKRMGMPECPIVMTSKGIEQNSGLLVSDAVVEILGEEHRHQVGCLSGPSIAMEVMTGCPTSVVSAAYDVEVMHQIRDAFAGPTFRVYPNSDINGVEFGGAMKNIMAIACGISDGLGFGDNTKAALMTRGLHEIRKLGVCKGCRPETLNGLAGMGDLCVTCLSKYSRNYRYGRLLAEGVAPEEAKEQIGMVVEGAYTCVSALQLGEKFDIPLPITEAVHQILYKGLPPKEAVTALMTRVTKEEHL